MKTSIIIPNWNGQEKLKRNLPKVLKVKGVDEVIIVDDASPDKSVEVIKNQFPGIKLIEKKNNTRFADTVNLGVEEAQGDLVFVLNNDAVPEQNCIEVILPHFSDSNVFSVSCNTGGSWSWAKFEEGFFWHFVSQESENKVHQTLWASGGSGVFRKKLWQELGGFDLIYKPFYEEDLDLGYRATKRGYINLFEPKAKVEHYKQVGVNKQYFTKNYIERVAQRNQLLFTWKNITDPELTRSHVRALIRMLITHPKYWLVFLSALIHLPEILKKRRVEKSCEKLSDKEILGQFTNLNS